MPFDHALLDGILKTAVKDRLVDYAAVEKKKADLEQYLKRVADVDLVASDDERLAFYANAYNARVLAAFLAHGKVKVTDVKGFFDAEKAKVAGELLTLNELEEQKIRRLDPQHMAKDARVHFIVNCASKDCPPLADHAYTGRSMQKDLEDRTRSYLERPGEVLVDAAGKRIVVVQIFEWYAADFGGEKGVRLFLARYLPALKDKLLDDAWDLDYRPYDWAPNAR